MHILRILKVLIFLILIFENFLAIFIKHQFILNYGDGIMLKKVTFSLILLILFSSCLAGTIYGADIDEASSLGSASYSYKLNLNDYIVKDIDIFEFFPSFDKSVDLYLDGENASVEVFNLGFDVDTNALEEEILDYTFEVIQDPSTNITTLRNGIEQICLSYGVEDVTVNIDSSIGENQIPLIFKTQGDSMLPTIKSGQSVLVNKTHEIEVGDLVSAQSPEYGGICKRVEDIDGDSVFLVSDNKNVSYEYHEDYYIEIKGIKTWVNINDIDGEIISIFD